MLLLTHILPTSLFVSLPLFFSLSLSLFNPSLGHGWRFTSFYVTAKPMTRTDMLVWLVMPLVFLSVKSAVAEERPGRQMLRG